MSSITWQHSSNSAETESQTAGSVAGVLAATDRFNGSATGSRGQIRTETGIVCSRRSGWLVGHGEFDVASEHALLASLGDCDGPVKIVGESLPRMMAELAIQMTSDSPGDWAGSEITQEVHDPEFAMLCETVDGWIRRRCFPDWNPPPLRFLQQALEAAGQTAAGDDSGGLRLTIRLRHREGQIRLICSQGRLRFVMPLGHWSGLEQIQRTEMLRLAYLVNGNTRLVRIVWRDTGKDCSCEAQIDLTGLPWTGEESGFLCRIWRANLVASLAALEVILRQLPVELEVLADRRNSHLWGALHRLREVGPAPAAPTIRTVP